MIRLPVQLSILLPLLLAVGLATAPLIAIAQEGSGNALEIDIDGAQFAPLPIAITPFVSADPGLNQVAGDLVNVIKANLERSGLFQIIPEDAFISQITDFDVTPNYADWRAINADAMVAGKVFRAADGRIQVQFRVFDTNAEEQLEGLQFLADPADWRRVAHKVSDGVYSKLTGEGPYFDSRIVFVDETGPKGDRRKRLAIMDQDGENLRFLQGTSGLVLTPRFSPNDQSILYIAYDTGEPRVFMLNLDTGQRERLGNFPGMSFAPRFSPDGRGVIMSLSRGGNTDIYVLDLGSRQLRRLTRSPSIDTSPSFSPDGSQIVFESDRGGGQQLYIMPASGGSARRISFSKGTYGTPVWSPKGDMIAFTKIQSGRFHIGVMRPDGSDERLLSASFLEEGPSFAPNGRILTYYRETPGQNGRPNLMSVDVTGRNLRIIPTPNAGSDPAWSPLRK
ncbi:MAG: Tol-Pal system beta propeller repeat protein TolB [Pseudomonadota bacterium]